MARDTDRKIISEAIRLQSLWQRDRYGNDYPNGTFVELVTGYDERLHIQYGPSGICKSALYTHWDGETGQVVTKEPIRVNKRARVLQLINQKDVS